MEYFVVKRDGSVEPFEHQKISVAVTKAMQEAKSFDETALDEVTSIVCTNIMGRMEKEISVDDIHIFVENALMDIRQHDTARAYINHRNMKKPDVFRPREAYKPFEYPTAAEFGTAIHASFWVHTEYDYTPDVQDIKVNMTFAEALAAKRCMLAISQVEVKVKDFWGKVGDRFPKPEIQETGAVFADSEVRHSRAYSHGLEKLGLNHEFENLLKEPVFKKRQAYIKKAMAGAKSDDNCEYIKTLLFFTMFIENVSLFSQFFVLSQFNKEKRFLSGLSNAIAATALEENVHFLFGSYLIGVLRQEHPEYFTEELNQEVREMVQEALTAEIELLEWIFELGDFDYMHLSDVIEYVKKRFNRGLSECGFETMFEPLESSLDRTSWFDVQIDASMHTDFLNKRTTNYTVKQHSYDEASMFDDEDDE